MGSSSQLLDGNDIDQVGKEGGAKVCHMHDEAQSP